MPKIIKLSVIFLLTLLLSQSSFGQEIHYTFEDLPCVDKHFNVALHLPLDRLGNANITQEEIDTLFIEANLFFEPICMSFGYCSIDTIENYSFDSLTVGRMQKSAEHFNRDHMINIFLASTVASPDPCHVGNFEGITSPETAFGFLAKGCDGGGLAHVFGHILGLYDTFEGFTVELVDGSNCATAGDRLCDTPADPYNFSPLVQWTSECKFINVSETDANGELYNPQVGNVMSGYRLCRKGFTRQQFLRMVEVYSSLDFEIW